MVIVLEEGSIGVARMQDEVTILYSEAYVNVPSVTFTFSSEAGHGTGVSNWYLSAFSTTGCTFKSSALDDGTYGTIYYKVIKRE